MAIRRYSELIRFHTFEERFEYLMLKGQVGKETFGFDRYINQRFYHSEEWRQVKNRVIARDLGRDLGVEGYDIYGRIYVHHMNPILVKDIEECSEYLMDPEYLITTTFATHNAIHYGDESFVTLSPKERSPNDTCPWKR